MAPHCDAMDGPVVKAAKLALETGNVNHILAWVHKEAEEELKKAFNMALETKNSEYSCYKSLDRLVVLRNCG